MVDAPRSWRAAAPVPQRAAETELLGRLDAQRAEVVAELDRRYRGRVRAYALRLLGNPSDAEDVTQEVFMAVHRSLHRFEGRSRIGTWILGIARRQALRHRLRRRRCVDLETAGLERIAAEQVPADRATDAALLLALCRQAIETELTPGLREAMDRCVRQAAGMQVAGAPGGSADAMKTRLYRSRAVLVRRVPGVREFLGGREVAPRSALGEPTDGPSHRVEVVGMHLEGPRIPA